MTRREAKVILLGYRPGVDASEPEVAAALAQVEADPELKRWFEQHCVFQEQVRSQLRSASVPPNVMIPTKVIPGPGVWWTRPAALSAAAALLATAISLWLWFKPEPPANRFENYQARMAAVVLRDYHMDLKTNDMSRLREFLGQKGAPSDYQVPAALAPVPLTGGGVHTWRGKPVSMVCFDPGAKSMVFMFVVDQAGIRGLPPNSPKFERINTLVTASWTEGTKAYLLATEAADESALRKYL